ncbi:1-phosphatidylinositol 4,5-bisphosphate phosphodiesterase beta-2 [Esox lucius]|uniref:1-phosphatidylinositol 4,5-bisphosphate phosphodiesterase beta-2 n=1 Tax=Esox lucius TaxID=8010 RepID=UPI00147691F4|nr:1-phosphatidylinositol 4,5-bisphosphate phosphodiesterase beta-2 [Esox lucius]
MDKRRYTLEPPEVKDYLVKGDRFTKWSEDSTKTVPVTMKMDPKGYYLYWTNQSKETEFLDVATIRDTRSGKYAKLPKHPKVRNVFNLDFPNSDHLLKTLTVVTGPDMVNLTYLNFFAYKEKVTQNWAADILSIVYNPLRNNACRQVFLEKMYVRISLHTNKDGKIPVKTIYKMFPADKKRVEGALASARLPKGKGDTMKPDVFTEAAFKLFLMSLCPRPEIYEIFTSYSAKAKPYMTKETLAKFINEMQRDSRLNEELFPRIRPDQVKALIEKYEPSSSNRGQISPEGLLLYLMGPETSVVILDKLAKCHDMSQPLPHYLIKSSHNTYLTAGQFSGASSPEMYRQCLLAGCRCLELDCWKGKPPDEEPIITHGFTMTTEILFKDVIEAIAESAFKTSQYPVILSFENHVDSVKQQEKMANYCRTIFGDMLLTDPLENYPLKPGLQIPSPAELMGKIIIKNKKGSQEKPNLASPKKTAGLEQTTATASPGMVPSQDGELTMTGEVTITDDPDEQQEEEDQDEEKMKNSDEGTAGQEVTAYEEMSAIVNYIQPTKFISFENSRKKNKSYLISSFVETKGESMISKNAVEFVEYNKRQMSRIYPKGTRMDSSNYNPQPFWNAGCQMVALNYQTMDFPMQLNMALFEFNGRTGYLLKHDLLRRSDKKFDPYCDRIDTLVANTLTIKIYSGQFLSDKNVKTGVEVEIIGLPGDPKKKYRTRWSSTANALNPVWNEEPFVFEKILLPDMASLRVVVYEEGGRFLGHRTVPIGALQSGFQHICLRSESNMPLTLPALFVYIEVKDYIPAAFADFTDALFNPTKNSEKTSKTTESSADYVSPYEMPLVNGEQIVGEMATPKEIEPEVKASVVEDEDTTQDTSSTPEEVTTYLSPSTVEDDDTTQDTSSTPEEVTTYLSPSTVEDDDTTQDTSSTPEEVTTYLSPSTVEDDDTTQDTSSTPEEVTTHLSPSTVEDDDTTQDTSSTPEEVTTYLSPSTVEDDDTTQDTSSTPEEVTTHLSPSTVEVDDTTQDTSSTPEVVTTYLSPSVVEDDDTTQDTSSTPEEVTTHLSPSTVEDDDTTQDTSSTPEQAPPQPDPNMDTQSQSPASVEPVQSIEEVPEHLALCDDPELDPEPTPTTELTADPKVDATSLSDPSSYVDAAPNLDSILDVSSDVIPQPDPDVESTPVADPAITPVSLSEASSSNLPLEDSTLLVTNEEVSTVPCEELLQHKSFLKVTKRQQKDMKELEKKFLKKGEELMQKYSDTFKALKKKTSMKKKDGGGETAEPDSKVERGREQKERLQVELRALWVEQCDQLKKKKEQHATERLAKLLEMATERHISELNALESESTKTKKKGQPKRSSLDKARLKRALSVDLAEESAQTDTLSTDSSPQQDALVKKQMATLDQIKGLANQLNLEALAENERRMRSLPVDLREAVNACVGPHFPDLVDQAGERQQDGVCFYGNVFLG